MESPATATINPFSSGLTPRAIRLMVEAEEVRIADTVEVGDTSSLPPTSCAKCAGLLAGAFASTAYHNYRPDYVPSWEIAVSALKNLLGEFQDFPETPSNPTLSPFLSETGITGYTVLEDWCIARKKMPDPELFDGKERENIENKIRALGVKALGNLVNLGIDSIVPSNDVPEDPSGAKIEACIVGIAKSCRYGVFDIKDPEDIALSPEDASAIAGELIEAHTEFFAKSEEIATEREEALSLSPSQQKQKDSGKEPRNR